MLRYQKTIVDKVYVSQLVKKMIIKNCKQCNKEFKVPLCRKISALFCSKACSTRFRCTGKKRPPFSKEWKEKLSLAGKNRKQTEETRLKISLGNKGKPKSKEHCKNISLSRKGKIWFKHTKESIENIILNNKTRFVSEGTKQKISKSLIGKCTGDKCHFYKGGISNDPYSSDWVGTLKKSIRERDHYTCQICGKEPSVRVHHIDYNKLNCNPENLITLCTSCHSKTNFDREQWIEYFNNK
jgi:hypothetical protein